MKHLRNYLQEENRAKRREKIMEEIAARKAERQVCKVFFI